MIPGFDVAAVISGGGHQDEIEHRIRLFGALTEVVTRHDLTVFVSHERAPSACRALANFMRNLENAQVKFDYILVGDAENALASYVHDVLEPAADPAFA